MPRLFTGIEISPAIALELAALRGGIPGARWVEPENYHLTLRFIGDVDDAIGREIIHMLGLVRRRGFELTLEGLGQFGGRKPRAVFVAASPRPLLIELQAEHERLLQRIGLPPEPRKYTPHITLARLRDVSTHRVADYLASRGPYRSPPFHVARFVLFSARAATGGGPYVVEAAYPLDG